MRGQNRLLSKSRKLLHNGNYVFLGEFWGYPQAFNGIHSKAPGSECLGALFCQENTFYIKSKILYIFHMVNIIFMARELIEGSEFKQLFDVITV